MRQKQINRKAWNLCLTDSGCVTELLFHISSERCRKRQTGLKLMIEQLFTDGFPQYLREAKQITLTKIPRNDCNQMKHILLSTFIFLKPAFQACKHENDQISQEWQKAMCLLASVSSLVMNSKPLPDRKKNYLPTQSPTSAQRAKSQLVYTFIRLQIINSISVLKTTDKSCHIHQDAAKLEDWALILERIILPILVMVERLDQSLLFLEMRCKQHTLAPTYWSIVWLHRIIWR